MTTTTSFIPKLTYDTHKGQLGRVGILGGCKEYTGAPYYAGISALRCGAELCHVFCTPSAATPIKSYSPELIVHPVIYDSGDARESGLSAPSELEKWAIERTVSGVTKWASALDVLVIGPGMGRDEVLLGGVRQVVAKMREASVPLVIDGDGMWMVTQHPEIVSGYKNVILTPNVVEYKRLCAALGLSDGAPAAEVAAKMGNLTVLEKGKVDTVSDGANTATVDQEGSPRRCGGQGDVLSGTTGTFFAWAHKYYKMKTVENAQLRYSPSMMAAMCSSRLTRKCANMAFAKTRRSTLTTDIIKEIGAAFEELYEN